ncbi:MAG: MBL fold metallo-hydrolase [Cyclobacteriaceae bacterium]|nr:MBL fold metallo-hydrolase [Cyclobacteriaceae bacterium]
MSGLIIIGSILMVVILIFVYFKTAPQLGGEVDGLRAEILKRSPQYKNGKFFNLQTTDMTTPPLSVIAGILTQGTVHDPDTTLDSKTFNKSDYDVINKEVKLTWFGHSSVLLSIDGKNLLIDPIFAQRASMFSFMGPKRYDYIKHVTVDDMPKIDAVIISHDHYDHLDYETFLKLKLRVNKYFVPLGVGVHLEAWGIPEEQISELDWWDEINFSETIQLAFTPSRHFSGRGIRDRFTTLWGSWVIQGAKQKLYFGGDSGYSESFKKIGEKYGPFDFAMLECGQYSRYWPEIHMMPEQTAQAGTDLKAKNVMPIHWGKFTLSIHNWREPVQRFVKASTAHQYNVIIPELNTAFTVPDTTSISTWWRE